jgi:hypothetical protein
VAREHADAASDWPPLAAVFGTGRSGSTWLGAVLDTHPGVAYRFEALGRLRRDPEIAALRERIRAGNAIAPDLERLYTILLRAHPATDKPPFFPKTICRTRGRAQLWALSSRLAALSRVYAIYTPTGRPPLITKEVGHEGIFLGLLESTPLRLVYLVRHPCGVVASVLRGQAQGLMPSARRSVLGNLLKSHDEELFSRWQTRLGAASPAEQEALLWRIDVERAVRAALRHPTAQVVVYEDMCRRPLEVAREVFAHFGIEMHEQTMRLLDEMSTGSASARRSRGERWTDPYFSVFRSPLEASGRWRTELSAEDQRRVLAVVSGSDAFAACAERGAWVV